MPSSRLEPLDWHLPSSTCYEAPVNNRSATMTQTKRFSNVANNYPSFQEIKPLQLNGYRWMETRQVDDKAEGLWRVHDKLYELTTFEDKHPGGSDWIRLTRGTDITESFEVHHIYSERVEKLLAEFYVRDAIEPRNVKLTFNQNGFYRTLKQRVANKLLTVDRKPEQETKLIIDGLLVASIALLLASVRLHSYSLLLVTSLTTAWTVISAHNFFHRRDNFRMYYFNLTLLSFREWRISHSMSHHLYPNSLLDLEVSLFEPFLCWVTDAASKNLLQRYISWLYSPIIYMGLFVDQLIKRIVFSVQDGKNLFHRSDVIPFFVPMFMYSLGGPGLGVGDVLKMWLFLVVSSSLYFGFVGLNAGHHNHYSVHDGDVLCENLDWGIYTLDSIIDNSDLRKSSFLALANFGHHALHHLFPTVDHGLLPQLYPVLYETIREFDVHLDEFPSMFHIVGQMKQLARIEPTDYATRLKHRLTYLKNGMA